MQNPVLIVLCSTPDLTTAQNLARELVTDGFAACCNILPGIQSVYRWESVVREDTECLLIIKTTQEMYAKLEQRILEKHPYEIPEIIACKLNAGSKKYLEWINETTGLK